MTDLITLAHDNGFTAWAAAEMSALTPLEDVRKMCEVNRCGRYGANWACPPACGSLEFARRRISAYNAGLLVQTTGLLSDEFDYEGISETSRRHARSFQSFARQARSIYPDCLPLTAGTCTVCKSCTYPKRPCRFPSKRISSMEAYGLFVSDVCLRSGLKYNYGERTITFTSCVLYCEE